MVTEDGDRNHPFVNIRASPWAFCSSSSEHRRSSARNEPVASSFMARLPLVDPDDPGLDPDIRERLTRSYGTRRGVPNVMRAMANHPVAMRVGAGVAYRPDSRITPAQRE